MGNLITSQASSQTNHVQILRKANNDDLLNLCKYFQYEKLVKKIKDCRLNGTHFTSYSQAYLGQKGTSVPYERIKLIAELVEEYNVEENDAEEFIKEVIDKKLEMEKKVMDEANVDESEELFNTVSNSPSLIRVPSEEYNKDVKEEDTYDPRVTIVIESLTDLEKQRVKKVKEKLDLCMNNLIERYSFEKLSNYGLTGDIEADAQSLVCKDKFLYNFFGSTMKNPKISKDKRNPKEDAFLSVKLVISFANGSYNNNDEENNISGNNGTTLDLKRKIIGPLYKFGYFHSFILIGQFRIDWTHDSIVTIKLAGGFNEKEAIVAIDLGNFTTKEEIEKAFHAIADVSIQYNGEKDYNSITCNNQKFTSKLLKEFEKINREVIIPKKNSSFERYFKELKKGETKRIFYYNDELKKLIYNKQVEEKYKEFYDKNLIIFNSRREIDLFCHWLKSLKYFETESGKVDYYLLKAFDRGFCLQSEDEMDDFLVVNGKEKSFFSNSGRGEDISLIQIKYNTQNLSFPLPKY
ncbi:hypothetical protein ABK040_005234 [Willaertia magna]